MMKKKILIGIGVAVVLGVAAYFIFRKDLSDQIIIPYLGHQKPFVDPQLPMHDPLSDKLDEVLFDGLFNIAATPSGVTYENGLGELVGIDGNFVVTIRLRPNAKWHNSYKVAVDDEDISVSEGTAANFTAQDLAFTLQRIQQLGSLSPDYILVYQALEQMTFDGPDDNGEIRFQFRKDRIWTDNDVKEVLSFKIVPAGSPMVAQNFRIGSGPYLATLPQNDVSDFYKSPAGSAVLTHLKLKPFVDNSTYATEMSNSNINVLMGTPYGSLSPVLADPEEFFAKSNIPTTFFAVLFNTEKLNRQQRHELKKLLSAKPILERFFKIGTEQQRHIIDYRGSRDQYDDLVNYSVFPSTSYYVEEKIVEPSRSVEQADLSVLPDTVRIKTCIQFGHREELSELTDILNNPVLTKGRVRATAVGNDDIKSGNYDAVLVAVNGYRSTFLFDLYDIFLRQPDFEVYRINVQTAADTTGTRKLLPSSMTAPQNFFRLDAATGEEASDAARLLEYIYGFMATKEIGDKQAYARFIDELDSEMALGAWLFSLPSLTYFSTQFDPASIDLYGVASQLSTIEKWKEKVKE
jgi:hypothetical protein